MRFDQWGLDLSLVPYGELGLTYRGSVNWRFGKPGADLVAVQAFARTAGQGKSAWLNVKLSAPDRVVAWGLYIYDSAHPAKLVRSFRGTGPPDRDLAWDGHAQGGQAAGEGEYWAALSARYTTGQTVYSKYVKLEVNNSVPVAELSLDPANLNPKAPEEAYIPVAFKTVLKAGRGIVQWRLEIMDPQGKAFRNIGSEGALPQDLIWDGKGDQGDALISNQVYSARLWVKDAIGNEFKTPAPVSFRAVFR